MVLFPGKSQTILVVILFLVKSPEGKFNKFLYVYPGWIDTARAERQLLFSTKPRVTEL